MIIDHIGAILFPELSVLRFIGRIAFPIYCFLMVDAYSHIKKDEKKLVKYIISLLLLAIISEIPYDLAFYNQPFYFEQQNVVFDLLFGLFMLITYDKIKKYDSISWITVYVFAIMALGLFLNYSFFGQFLIFGLYLYCANKKKRVLYGTIILFAFLQFATNPLLSLINGQSIDFSQLIKDYYLIGVLFSIPLILSYNGEKGYSSKIIKYAFYIAFPMHIIILYLIDKMF